MTQMPPAGAAPPINPMPPNVYQRGPVRGPPIPYRPETFATLYLWWAILFGVGILLSIIFVGIPAAIAAIVLSCVFHYKAWNQIQDGQQRTSPGKAVGFCFIPFFNFYWIFVAMYGLSQDLNGYTRRYQIAAPPVAEDLALAYCILAVCSIIPYLGILTALAAIVINFILMHQIRVASMAVAQAKLHAAGAA